MDRKTFMERMRPGRLVPVNPALGRMRQEDGHEFEASQD